MTDLTRYLGQGASDDPAAADAGADAVADAGDGQALLAGPWARFWARSVDLLVMMPLLAVAADLVFPALSARLVAARVGGILAAIMVLPFALIADAVLVSAWGRSPGKMAAGLVVRDRNGVAPSLDTALDRNLGLYARGFIMGIPILVPLGLIASYHCLSVRGVTVWDEDSDSYVVLAGHAERPARAAAVAVALLAALHLAWPAYLAVAAR